MRFHLKEYSKYLEITGYKDVNFVSAEAFLKAERKKNLQGIEIQFFDADLIATGQHLYFAAINALEAFRGNTNLSKSLAMETILYTSAQRQIQKAILVSGIKPQTARMAAVLIGDNKDAMEIALKDLSAAVGSSPDESVLGMSPLKEKKIKEAFQISDNEIGTITKDNGTETAIVDLVIEHIALLAAQL